jgi:hypothetical protein
MSAEVYPEHEKLSKVSDKSQMCGEFLEWLRSERVHLMRWREDLTDQRVVDPDCPVPPNWDNRRPCDRKPEDDSYYAWWTHHCAHWFEDSKDCCRCGIGHFREITGVKSWVEESRSITDLLAAFFEIDQGKIEAEKREMLAKLRGES